MSEWTLRDRTLRIQALRELHDRLRSLEIECFAHEVKTVFARLVEAEAALIDQALGHPCPFLNHRRRRVRMPSERVSDGSRYVFSTCRSSGALTEALSCRS